MRGPAAGLGPRTGRLNPLCCVAETPVVDCPRCGHSQIFPDASECERCGVIFARLGAEAIRAEPEAGPGIQAPASDLDGATEDPGIDAAGWRALTVGTALALASSFLPLFGVLIGMFVVLSHEMGHALAGWLFAKPSIPAFDFVYGGGVTAHLDRSLPLLLAIYAGFGFLAWMFRLNRNSLILVSVLAAAHALLVVSGGDRAFITMMGHGGELLIAALFLHRAISGRGCKLPVERPLYAWIALHIVIHDLRFAWGLITSDTVRALYGEAKGGGHWMDFDILAREVLHVPLEVVAAAFLAACLATPLVPLLGHWNRAHVEERLGRLLRVA
jgi:hypothetical protein